MGVPINLSWTEFKGFVTKYALTIDYAPEGIHYFLYSSNGSATLSAYITDPTDVLDFETFYKPFASEVSIPPSGGSPATLVSQGTTPWVCSIGSMSLPTGASTSALQTAGNASLSSIDTKTPAFGQALMAASSPVVLASDQSPVPTLAAQSGAWAVGATQSGAWTVAVSGTVPISAASLPLPTGASTEATLSTLNTKVPALGQAAMAASTPVVIASNQSSFTVAATQSGAWTVGVSGTVPISAAALPLPTGATTEATLLTRLTEATFTTRHPVVGQAAMAASMPVVIASDQSVFSVSLGASIGKTIVGKTGTLVTTAVTADQVILTYTVTGGKTFYLEGFDWAVGATALAHSDTDFGNISLETPSGAKIQTWFARGAGRDSFIRSIAEPLPIAAGTVIRFVVTPSATTSFTWVANLIGYEK